jgi:hypothetical protein
MLNVRFVLWLFKNYLSVSEVTCDIDDKWRDTKMRVFIFAGRG